MKRYLILSLLALSSVTSAQEYASSPKLNPATQFSKAVRALPARRTVCEKIKTEHQQLCGSEEIEGQCVLKNRAAIDENLKLIAKLPKYSVSEEKLWDQFTKMERPTKTDAAAAVTLLNRGCWLQAAKLWSSAIISLKDLGTQDQRRKTRDYLKKYITNDPSSSPTLIRLLMDQAIITRAANYGLLTVYNAEDEKSWQDIGKETRAQRDIIAREMNELTKAMEPTDIGDKAESPPSSVEKEEFDPVKVRELLVKEIALTKSLREKSKAWFMSRW